MFLYVIFIYSISVTTQANYDFFDPFFNEMTINDVSDIPFNRRIERYTKKSDDYDISTPTCEQMGRTSLTPFVVLVLFKTSGRFLGMGSIIDKQTVLTSAKVVENALNSPGDLLILAARLGPWWGRNSQVQPGADVFINDAGLALVRTEKAFKLDKNVAPIRVPLKAEKDIKNAYGKNLAIFGVPRSSWDIPGEPTPKSSIYLMKIEILLEDKAVDDCKKLFPDVVFNETLHFCTTANGSFCWGVLGSPGVGVTEKDKVVQISVITSASHTDQDLYHMHTKVAFYDKWIMSLSNINYNEEED